MKCADDMASCALSSFATASICNCFYKLFWKQPEQLVKTTSSFSPRNLAAILKPGAVAPGWQELFLSVVIVVSFSTKLIRIYIPARNAGSELTGKAAFQAAGYRPEGVAPLGTGGYWRGEANAWRSP